LNQQPKVVVAMSGGVDSSVAAAMLVEKGYDVSGMMLKLWSGSCEQEENACCTPEAIEQARNVAIKLEIPFYVIDAKEGFKHFVVDQFIDTHIKGFTPNPCYVCNQKIKWGLLLEKALQMGAQFLATGHYAQIRVDTSNKWHLFKGNDLKKDQSYFLSGLNQNQLSRTLLPLGGLIKTEVRKLASGYNLDVAEIADSQDLCFIGVEGYQAFLTRLYPGFEKRGIVRNTSGQIVGEHMGLAFYTIGQRKSVGSGLEKPHYVIKKEIENNELIIDTKEYLGFSSISIADLNWISGVEPNFPSEFSVKIRYKGIPVQSVIEKIEEKESYRIQFSKPVRDATPGQIAVLYKDDEVIGSGLIVSTEGLKL
jgi:tRNA-specific 2-thiouridylase